MDSILETMGRRRRRVDEYLRVAMIFDLMKMGISFSQNSSTKNLGENQGNFFKGLRSKFDEFIRKFPINNQRERERERERVVNFNDVLRVNKGGREEKKGRRDFEIFFSDVFLFFLFCFNLMRNSRLRIESVGTPRLGWFFWRRKRGRKRPS